MLYDNTTFLNSYGRTDVEGCCFWGRGALGTRGSVSILFYILGVFPSLLLVVAYFGFHLFLVQLREGEEYVIVYCFFLD